MTFQTDQILMSDTLLATLGRVDALTAAVLEVLELSRNIPELSMAIKENMAEHCANRLAKSEVPQYIQAFEDTRDQILRILR